MDSSSHYHQLIKVAIGYIGRGGGNVPDATPQEIENTPQLRVAFIREISRVQFGSSEVRDAIPMDQHPAWTLEGFRGLLRLQFAAKGQGTDRQSSPNDTADHDLDAVNLGICMQQGPWL